MKVIIIKEHPYYELGEVDVDEDRARYLIAVGIAEQGKEKKEVADKKEKKEIKRP